MTLNDLMINLNLKSVPNSWNVFFEAVMEDFEKRGLDTVNESYIIDLNNKYHLFNEYLADVLLAASKIRQQPFLMYFIYLLNHAMQDRTFFLNELSQLELPTMVGEDTEAYDFAPLFAVLPTIPNTVSNLNKHGVPKKIIDKTLTEYENCLNVFKLRFGRAGYDKNYFTWIQLMVESRLFRIGELYFERLDEFPGCVSVFKHKNGELCIILKSVRLHREGMILGLPGYQDAEGSYDANFVESDMYYEGYLVIDGRCTGRRERIMKKEWCLILSPEDPVINIHIPRDANLTRECCEKTFESAIEMFENCYPKFKYKAFVCFSWLLDQQLASFLKEDSKIIEFQNKFRLFPSNESDGKEVFQFVFLNPFEKLEDLSEDTSLKREIKRHYLKGKYIYTQGGVFFL